uniref:Putative Crossover junction endodeoxyribonuclease n=2 Tax=viral metagenome TaxID=1070528 RepID=A0A6H1ZWV8_9ZZZZ
MNILSFDPALTTGWASLWHEMGEPIHIVSSGSFTLAKAGFGERMWDFSLRVGDLIILLKPTFVIAEEVTFAAKKGNHQVRRLHSGLRAIIALQTWKRRGMEANFMAASSARKTIGVGGGASKDEVAQHLKSMGLVEEQPVDWGNDNISDAIALGVALIKEIERDK